MHIFAPDRLFTDIFDRLTQHIRPHWALHDHASVYLVAFSVYKRAANRHITDLAWCNLTNASDWLLAHRDHLRITLDHHRLIGNPQNTAANDQIVLNRPPNSHVKVVNIELVLQPTLQHGRHSAANRVIVTKPAAYFGARRLEIQSRLQRVHVAIEDVHARITHHAIRIVVPIAINDLIATVAPRLLKATRPPDLVVPVTRTIPFAFRLTVICVGFSHYILQPDGLDARSRPSIISSMVGGRQGSSSSSGMRR